MRAIVSVPKVARPKVYRRKLNKLTRADGPVRTIARVPEVARPRVNPAS